MSETDCGEEDTSLLINLFFVIEGRAHYRYGPCCSPFSMGFLDDRDERRPIYCAHFTQVPKKNVVNGLNAGVSVVRIVRSAEDSSVKNC